jgi:hypothetical protein
MNSKEDLCSLIEESPLTLIGYTFKDERIKDELISNFNYVEIKEIDSSFSFKSFLRNEKLNNILDSGKKFDYILLDLNNIRPTYDGVSMSGFPRWDKSSFIRNVLEKLRERIWVEGEPQYKIIVTSPLNKTSDKDEMGSFVGGNQPIYMADLVVVLKGEISRVIKNRNGRDGDYILYNTKQSVEI